MSDTMNDYHTANARKQRLYNLWQRGYFQGNSHAALTSKLAAAEKLAEAVEPLIKHCLKHIHPKPDKPNSDWAILKRAMDSWDDFQAAKAGEGK